MGIDERSNAEIARRVPRVAQPERIILFGSAARGEMTPDSDIDLLVLERTPLDPRRQSIALGDALRGLGFPFDVVVMATERFEETKDLIGGLAHPADKGALRANIDETAPPVVITEQGESRNQCEEQWNLFGFPHGFARRGT